MACMAALIVRRRGVVLLATLAAVVLAGVLGGGVVTRLKSAGFDDPASESSRADAALADLFRSGEPNLVLLVRGVHGGVDDPQVAAVGRALATRLAAEDGVREVTSHWSASAPRLRSRDGRSGLVLARIDGDEDAARERVAELGPRYRADGPVASVAVGGSAEINRQITEQIEGDLRRAETLALPVTLVLLVLVFGSLVAGALPLLIGGLAIVGTLLVLRGLSSFTDVSTYSLNLTTALGLGLAIDYSLFIVSRYREELARGLATGAAVVEAVRTAGRTVLFSAGTVAVSLAAMLVFPGYFLRSFAYAGIAVVAVATVGAVVVLPALLALLGRRVELLGVRRRAARARTRSAEGAAESALWRRVALAVMRRPALVAAPVVAFLLLLGTPFLGVRFGLPDDRTLPASASSRQVAEVVRTEFATRDAQALTVVAPTLGDPGTRRPQLDRYAAALSRLDGVARVDAPTGVYARGRQAAPNPAAARFATDHAARFAVIPTVEPYSGAGERLVRDVREVAAPFRTLVTGPSAVLVDTRAGLLDRLPLALALIGLITFALLFLMTGSVLIPLKALVMNLLSLTAVYGAMVWVFQEGHLAGLLGFTPTGTIAIAMPILMFCIAFGLSMDYEVFLLSRIKEEHDRTGDTTTAVAWGLARTGRIVTSAAALVAIVFVAFGTSRVAIIQLLGLGTALAVVMDATLIRGLLVPAFMRVAGPANWWAPRPLRRLHARVGLRESAPAPALEAGGGR
jgi:RND superfamily putative drug exporter